MLVARGVKERGHRLVVAGFTGHTNMEVVEFADEFRELKLGKLGKLISYFKEHGVDEVIMAGTIHKPKIMDIGMLDMRATKFILKITGRGDSSVLAHLAKEFESEGMRVVPPQTMVPDLLTPPGTLGRHKPDDHMERDIRFGIELAEKLGALDIGQCVVVKEGVVAAVEALEGTDMTIARGCELAGPGAVVIKIFKPGQDDRSDLPSVGPDTIEVMARGKAGCLAIPAGRSLLFEIDRTVALADEAGIAIVGFSADSD